MVDVRVLRQLEILHDSTRSYDTFLQMLYTEAFQRLRTEMLQQFLSCVLLCEHPVVELKDSEFRAEILFKLLALCLIVEHFFRSKVANELLHVVVGTLTSEELTRRDIEEADSACCLSEVNGRKEVVLLVVQDVIAHGDAWGHKFRDASLHHLVHLGEPFLAFYHGAFLLWVLELVADSHTFTRTDKLRQIGVEGVVGETCHLSACRSTVVALGERQTKNLRGFHGIVAVSLVEVATAEE